MEPLWVFTVLQYLETIDFTFGRKPVTYSTRYREYHGLPGAA